MDLILFVGYDLIFPKDPQNSRFGPRQLADDRSARLKTAFSRLDGLTQRPDSSAQRVENPLSGGELSHQLVVYIRRGKGNKKTIQNRLHILSAARTRVSFLFLADLYFPVN